MKGNIFDTLDQTLITDSGSHLPGAIKKELAAAKKRVSGESCVCELCQIVNHFVWC